MALIKRVELANGIVADQAYHVVSDVITFKIPSDKPDPGGARPDNTPDHVWKKGITEEYASRCTIIKQQEMQVNLPYLIWVYILQTFRLIYKQKQKQKVI